MLKVWVSQDPRSNTANFLGHKNGLVIQFGAMSQRRFAGGFYETIFFILLRKWLEELFILILGTGSQCGPVAQKCEA